VNLTRQENKVDKEGAARRSAAMGQCCCCCLCCPAAFAWARFRVREHLGERRPRLAAHITKTTANHQK
jgi:hypothetical protein